MPRKKAAQRRGVPDSAAAPELWESGFTAMMKAHKEDPKRAPWEQERKPWGLVIAYANDIQTALKLAPGDSALQAALVAAVDINKLALHRDEIRNIDQAARQRLNKELGARWAGFMEQLEDLSQVHDLRFYKGLTASKEEHDTPNNITSSNS
jgi:hypothetical protein